MADYLIVCDLSWLMYRSYYTYTVDRFNYTDEEGKKPNGHIYGVLRSVLALKQKFKNADIVLCKDGIPKERIELLGGSVEQREDGSFKIDHGSYKEGRGNCPYNLHKDADLICDIVSDIPGCSWAFEQFKESDDLMYSLAKSNSSKYKKVFIYSGDNDLLQTIDENIFVIRSLAKDAIVLDDYYVRMESEYRIPAKCLPIYRSLRGDDSDTIEGVYPRLSKDFARYVATTFSSIEEIEWYTPDPKEKWFKWFQRIQNPKSLKLLERNYKLMKLHEFPVELRKSRLTRKDIIANLDRCRLWSYKKLFEGGSL